MWRSLARPGASQCQPSVWEAYRQFPVLRQQIAAIVGPNEG